MLMLYTDDAEISDESKQALIAAGIIPIRVADKDAIKILPMPAPVIENQDMNAIFRAAMTAIVKSHDEGSNVSRYFGGGLARMLKDSGTAGSE